MQHQRQAAKNEKSWGIFELRRGCLVFLQPHTHTHSLIHSHRVAFERHTVPAWDRRTGLLRRLHRVSPRRRVVLPPFAFFHACARERVSEWAIECVASACVCACLCACSREERVSRASVLIVSARGEFVSFVIRLWQWEEQTTVSVANNNNEHSHTHSHSSTKYAHTHTPSKICCFKGFPQRKGYSSLSKLTIKSRCSRSTHIISQRQLVTVTTRQRLQKRITTKHTQNI